MITRIGSESNHLQQPTASKDSSNTLKNTNTHHITEILEFLPHSISLIGMTSTVKAPPLDKLDIISIWVASVLFGIFNSSRLRTSLTSFDHRNQASGPPF